MFNKMKLTLKKGYANKCKGSLNIYVEQRGIGDLFLLWQKFYPLNMNLNFTIFCPDHSRIGKRQYGLLNNLKNVSTINYVYERLTNIPELDITKNLKSQIEGKSDLFLARPATWIHRGNSIDNWFEGAKTEWGEPIMIEIDKLKRYSELYSVDQPYPVLYTSQYAFNKRNGYDFNNWVEIADLLIDMFGIVVYAGADWDIDGFNNLRDGLSAGKQGKVKYILGESLDIFLLTAAFSKMFIGYTCGLNFLTNYIGVKNAGIYTYESFEYKDQPNVLIGTWEGNSINNGNHIAFHENDPVGKIISTIKEKWSE